jgi:hypothetical protein
LIGQNEHLELPTLYIDPSKAREAADPMIQMDDEVVGAEVPEVGGERPDSRASSARPRGGGEIATPVNGEDVIPDEAVLQLALDDRHPARRRRRRYRLHLALTQEMGKAPALAERGHHQYLTHVLGPARPQRRHQVGKAPHEVLRRVGGKTTPGRRSIHQFELLEPQRRFFNRCFQVFGIEQKTVGRRQLHHPPTQSLPLAILYLPPTCKLA